MNSTYQNSNRRKDSRKAYAENDLVEHSNLQVTASEFVPNNKWDRRNFTNPTKSRRGRSNNDHQSQDNQVFFENNRRHFHDKKFENKRDAGKRWYSSQNDQYYNDDGKKDYNRGPSNRKYQNEKYDNRSNLGIDDTSIAFSANNSNSLEKRFSKNQEVASNSNNSYF